MSLPGDQDSGLPRHVISCCLKLASNDDHIMRCIFVPNGLWAARSDVLLAAL